MQWLFFQCFVHDRGDGINDLKGPMRKCTIRSENKAEEKECSAKVGGCPKDVLDVRWKSILLLGMVEACRANGRIGLLQRPQGASPVIQCQIEGNYAKCLGEVPPGFVNKKRNMEAMLNTSISTLQEMSLSIPDCSLTVNLASGGSFREDELCIARSQKRMKCTMVPNPYFGDLYEWEAKENMLMKQNIPWNYKHDQAFYRGRCARRSESRFKIIDIDHPRLDVGWIRQGLTPRCLRAYTDTTEVVKFHFSRSGRPFTEGHFSKFKFLVRLPGSTGASYSRHLNYLWNKGAIVLLWESKAEEWYYHALRENVTHLVVNEENIVQVIEECLRSPVDRQLRLVMEAQTVYQQHLSRPALALAWYRVMLSKGVYVQ